jgi:MFS transporter, DHA2 family, methylenomycin A resistance protein
MLHVPHPHLPRRAAAAPAAVNPTAVLVTSCAVLFMIAVNTTAINTALNAIAEDLGMGSGELSWAVGIYLLAAAAFIVVGGRLGDMYGERPVLIAGLVVFSVAALVIALADAAWVVIAGRFGQGLAAAIMMPATMAVLRIAYPPERQGFALGIWGAVGGVAFAVGPLIGGVLTDAASWRWVWWGSLALAGVLIWASLATLRAMPRPSERPRFDPLGVALLAVSLFALILAIQQGPVWGWESPGTIAAFAASAAGLAALVAVEMRIDHPTLHLRLLRIPALAAANLGTFANAVFLIGVLYFFNLYAQSVVTLDYSAIGASVALLPYGACVFAASLVIGRVCDRVGFRWPIAAGLVLMGVGSLVLSRVDAASDYGDLWWPTMVLGLGVGISFSAPSAAGLRAVRAEEAGEASGIINVVRYLGAALVVAVGTVFYVSVGSDDLNRSLERAGIGTQERETLDKTLTGAPSQVRAAEGQLSKRDRRAYEAGAGDGVAGGFAAVMLGTGIFSLIATFIWVVLMRPARGP